MHAACCSPLDRLSLVVSTLSELLEDRIRQQVTLVQAAVKQPPCPPSPAPTCKAVAILYTNRACYLLKYSVRGQVKIQPDMAQQPLHWVSGIVVLDDAHLQKDADTTRLPSGHTSEWH